jgi:2-polyprenyl-3-methyl-5-hydroxy-6-metoxy-1,4-benzoquinol methylase
MGRHVRLGELLLGLEGAALLRNVLDGDDDFVARRVEALRRILDEGDSGPLGLGSHVPELDPLEGYAAWAPIYDAMENAMIRAEEPIVHRVFGAVPPGDALDAACGTGRHAAALVAAGHRTVGVDQSDDMLAVARAKVTEADFRVADVTALPFDDGTFDLAVCALALTHLADPTSAVAELARVVRPGGTVVLSDAHPTFVSVQGQALFPVGDGFAYVRNHVHRHSTYLAAFAAAGLAVMGCDEPPLQGDFSTGLMAGAAEAAEALWADMPIALVWTLVRP